jgi:hypothetical protein
LGKAWADRENWSPTMQQQSAAFADKRIWDFMRSAGLQAPGSRE